MKIPAIGYLTVGAAIGAVAVGGLPGIAGGAAVTFAVTKIKNLMPLLQPQEPVAQKIVYAAIVCAVSAIAYNQAEAIDQCNEFSPYCLAMKTVKPAIAAIALGSVSYCVHALYTYKNPPSVAEIVFVQAINDGEKFIEKTIEKTQAMADATSAKAEQSAINTKKTVNRSAQHATQSAHSSIS